MALAKPLVVTAGEPAGIGPELCAALSASPHADDLVIIGDRRLLGSELRVIDAPFPAPVVSGKPDSANARTLIDGLTRAVKGCLDGEFSGLVTAPLSKSVIADAGIPFTGHTELLAELTNAALPVMLLVADKLRVALASTHLPLSEVPGYITAERLRLVIEILESELRAKFKITHPDIVVCGLNPHAGEGGHLGREEIETIIPTLQGLRDEGIDLDGPLPADTVFNSRYIADSDVILAMYHDQGLPVLKHSGFGRAVNITLGLPIIRTSVDHGTALELAGTGKVDIGSLQVALDTAMAMARLSTC